MRGLAHFLLATLFTCLTIGFIAALTVRFSPYSAEYVKSTLVSNQAYPRLIDLIQESLAAAEAESDQELANLITPFVEKEITPLYVQTKTEGVIDATSLWLRDAKSPEPTLSFVDLKEKLVQKNPKLFNQLVKMAADFEKQRPQLEAAMREAAEANGEVYAALPDINITELLEKDPAIQLGIYLQPLRVISNLSQSGLYYLLFAIILTLLFIYLLHRNSFPTRAIGKVFLGTAVLCLIPVLVLYVSALKIVPLVLPHIPAAVLPITSSLLNPLFTTYYRIALTVIGVYIVVAAVMYMVPQFLMKFQVKPHTKKRVVKG